MRSLCRRYIFFYEGQDFVMKQRIRCCLWKRTNRSHLQNSMPLASFEYSLKNVSCFSTPIVDCVFVVKKNPEPKWKINFDKIDVHSWESIPTK
eukprot:UN21825